jgi:small-conductance mechanosensitive channel
MATLAGRGWHSDWQGNTALSWLCAAAGAVAGYLLARAVLAVLRARLGRLARRRPGTGVRSVVAVLDAVRPWLLAPLALVIAADFLSFGDRLQYWLRVVTFLLVGVQLVLCANRVIVAWLHRSAADGERPGEVPVMLGILTWTAQFVVWVTFLLALLTNAGLDITAFVASLGIGGIAVALALQNILGDLFSSIAIGLDKPFEVGDFIAFGTDLGTVTRVGVKTTRISSLSGEQLAVANSQLLAQLIHNYSRMGERRVVFGFTVPYSTTRAQLDAITERTNRLIADADPVRHDRGHFTGFGPDGFTFEFVYYVLDPSYTVYRDVQQRLNGQIMDVLDGLGVRFAVAARSVTLAERHD